MDRADVSLVWGAETRIPDDRRWVFKMVKKRVKEGHRPVQMAATASRLDAQESQEPTSLEGLTEQFNLQKAEWQGTYNRPLHPHCRHKDSPRCVVKSGNVVQRGVQEAIGIRESGMDRWLPFIYWDLYCREVGWKGNCVKRRQRMAN
jgi:hypothetical protein